MKKILLTAVILLAGCSADMPHDTIKCHRIPSPPPRLEAAATENNGYSPLNYERRKGIWLSYIDLAPMLSADNADDFRGEFDTACSNIAELGCNTIYVQVRPFGDAIYDSTLFPPSEYLSGAYDPLEIMCGTAHEHELSIHAWINPLRLQTADKLTEFSGFTTADWFIDGDDRVSYVGEDYHLWLDPAYPEVRDLIAEGAYEIAENYDVDGIHYDDYFYPTTDSDYDAKCFAEMGGDSSLDEWRRDNISEMCCGIYDSVKSVDRRIEVSISPQGNIENNIFKLYADVEKWCSEEGYCDRIIPQIYFGFENTVKPFISTLNEWQEICRSGEVNLDIGLAVYKVGTEEEFTESVGIIARQIEDCKDCQGISLYAYSSLFGENSEDERIVNEREAIRNALAKY
ncbi:glycoside hydrolase family 10 protein [Ruminococcus albus]|uniref:Uncharacterized lipoprotein YddW, UPF0748 family n=1 Tax=Ruminococcus albus TaxID=1264 RepID=A0A1I1DTX1_RUMAL|nr:family 10 glycosylhydrolase [Ruminococcus albus]SFB77872.1 Uncharacterized lipoprotein YddW, UPF0748 family [Ruminococcus albus]